MTNRDYLAEMGDIIDMMTAEDELVARVVADDIIKKLRATDPELLAGWLDARAGEILGAFIRTKLNSQRSYSRSMRTRSVFANAAAQFVETGDPGSWSLFESLVTVGPHNLRRRFGDLTKADCLYVADSYARSRKESELYEKFHRKLAERLGDKTIKEVYSESQCTAMLSSFGVEYFPTAD